MEGRRDTESGTNGKDTEGRHACASVANCVLRLLLLLLGFWRRCFVVADQDNDQATLVAVDSTATAADAQSVTSDAA